MCSRSMYKGYFVYQIQDGGIQQPTQHRNIENNTRIETPNIYNLPEINRKRKWSCCFRFFFWFKEPGRASLPEAEASPVEKLRGSSVVAIRDRGLGPVIPASRMALRHSTKCDELAEASRRGGPGILRSFSFSSAPRPIFLWENRLPCTPLSVGLAGGTGRRPHTRGS